MRKKKQTITHDEWMKEVFGVQKKPEGAFTIDEVVAKTGINRSTLQARIYRMIQRGELIKGEFCNDGHLCNYYIKVEKE